MKKSRGKHLAILCIALACIIVSAFLLFSKLTSSNSVNPPLTNVLTDNISRMVLAYPGEIGVAIIISNTDTAKISDKSVYPTINVFKAYQVLALYNDFDNKGISLDALVKIDRDGPDSKTWSSMTKDYFKLVIPLIMRDLSRYTIIQSDNNANGLMFKDMVSVVQTDSFIVTLTPRSSFQVAYTEEEMSTDHDKAYFDYTSPLGATMSMNRLLTESIVSGEKQNFIESTLKECTTGTGRVVVPPPDKEKASITYKTGLSYVNENDTPTAHNDVAYICPPNNVCYTLTIFVKDFRGNESQASQYAAHILEIVYSLLIQSLAIP